MINCSLVTYHWKIYRRWNYCTSSHSNVFTVIYIPVCTWPSRFGRKI